MIWNLLLRQLIISLAASLVKELCADERDRTED